MAASRWNATAHETDSESRHQVDSMEQHLAYWLLSFMHNSVHSLRLIFQPVQGAGGDAALEWQGDQGDKNQQRALILENKGYQQSQFSFCESSKCHCMYGFSKKYQPTGLREIFLKYASKRGRYMGFGKRVRFALSWWTTDPNCDYPAGVLNSSNGRKVLTGLHCSKEKRKGLKAQRNSRNQNTLQESATSKEKCASPSLILCVCLTPHASWECHYLGHPLPQPSLSKWLSVPSSPGAGNPKNLEHRMQSTNVWWVSASESMWKDRWTLLTVLNSTRMEKWPQLKNENSNEIRSSLQKGKQHTHTHIYNYTLYI